MKKWCSAFLLCGLTPLLVWPDASQGVASGQKVVTAAQVNGTWKDQANTFKVWALGKQRLRVEFLGSYEYRTPAGPMAHSGSGSGVAFIEGETARFRPEGADRECEIVMTFTGGKLVVEQEGGCGFGHNVMASGTYRKVSHRKPKFNDD